MEAEVEELIPQGVSVSWPNVELLLFRKNSGEGNGTPLQYSCLENPRDGKAWWAAIYGVTQSWTRLSDLATAAARLCIKY